MGGRSWTELFFLDEATALAAGHRPCFYCRRDDANRFRAAWEAGQRLSDVLAPDIDAVLHRERLMRRNKRLHALPMPWRHCPTARWCNRPPSFLIVQGRAIEWSPAGYRDAADSIGRCHAADAALDAARAVCALSAAAASECKSASARNSINCWTARPENGRIQFQLMVILVQ